MPWIRQADLGVDKMLTRTGGLADCRTRGLPDWRTRFFQFFINAFCWCPENFTMSCRRALYKIRTVNERRAFRTIEHLEEFI
jgi:hypothetical protein